MQIEPTIYSHPWTRGNFSDSLNSGYSAWVLRIGKTNEMIGYSLLMMVMDEAHLLNLSIAKAPAKTRLGALFVGAHGDNCQKPQSAEYVFRSAAE